MYETGTTVRIGIDAARAFKHPRTGTERYAWEILRSLLQLPQAHEHEWHLFVDRNLPPDETASLADQAQAKIVWHVLPWQRMWTHRILGRAVRQARLHVMFVPSHVIPFTWPAMQNPPTVVTIHDLGYRHWPQTHPTFQRLYLELSTRWNLHAANHVIAVSEATRLDIRSSYGAPKARLHVVHEAADPGPKPSPQAIAQARQALDLPPLYGLFTGTLHPRKNIARLIAAYARLYQQEAIEWPLVLAGASGWQATQFQAEIAAQGIGEKVLLPGYVPQSQLEALLAGARFFAFPSLFEGFGLPVLEAQSAGVPVMTSNYSSLPEVAGDAALFVDPTDIDAIAQAMLRLSHDDGLRARLIAAGHENVKRFSWEKAADETFEVLRQAAEDAR